MLWSKALAFLRRRAKPFVYITSPKPLNPHLQPWAINITNPILQVSKTNPKEQIQWDKTPHPKEHRESSTGLLLLTWRWAKDKDINYRGRKQAWRGHFWTLVSEVTIPVLCIKPELTSTGLLLFPNNNYNVTRPLAKADSRNCISWLLPAQLFPRECHSPKFQANTLPERELWGKQIPFSEKLGASGYDSGN